MATENKPTTTPTTTPAPVAKPKMKFRATAGFHVEGKGSDARKYGPQSELGDVFESEHDMVKAFGAKFERVHTDTPTGPRKVEVVRPTTDDIKSMTVKQLTEYAAENEIDLHGAHSKERMVQIVLKYLGEQE